MWLICWKERRWKNRSDPDANHAAQPFFSVEYSVDAPLAAKLRLAERNEGSVMRGRLFMGRLRHCMRIFAIAPIRFYQWFISPVLPPSCRFCPTCSAYAAEAVLVHGIFRGSWLALRRLVRCNPWCKGGYDPVPPLPDSDEQPAAEQAVKPVKNTICAGDRKKASNGS